MLGEAAAHVLAEVFCDMQFQKQLEEATAAKDGAEAAVRKLRAAAKQSATAALAAAEARCADLEERLRAAQAAAPPSGPAQPGPVARDSAGNGPPAMAGPGAHSPC